MRVIGLDFGSTTGFGIIENGELSRYGALDFSDKKQNRNYKLYSWLMNHIENGEIVAVAHERVDFLKGKNWRQIYYGFAAVCEVVAGEAGIRYESVPVGTLKKYATGKGNSHKNKMVSTVNEKHSLALLKKQHDVADAIWVADWCWNEIKEGKSESV